MKALLLNSGQGSRMGELTQDKPKCMCPIGNGYSIISWQLELLRKHGINNIVITTGPFAELLEDYILVHGKGLRLTFVNNPLYKETNYIYSMYLAREHLKDDILLLHGDLVIEPSVINDLLSEEYSVVTVDRTLPLPEKDFKAKLKDDKVISIGVELFGSDCVACQPAYKWTRSDFSIWMREIEVFCERGHRQVYAENAFNAVSNQINLHPLELNKRLCSEIDNINDLQNVSERFQQISM